MRSSDSSDILTAFDTKIQEYFTGHHVHSKNLVLGLFDLLASNRMSPHPSPPASPHHTTTSYSDANYEDCIWPKDAIIRSLTTGIFLDSMFYVWDTMEQRPLFFCSSTTPGLLNKISGQYERDFSSVDPSKNEWTEIGKLVPTGALRASSERMIPRGGSAIDSQNATSQKVLVVTLGDFRT